MLFAEILKQNLFAHDENVSENAVIVSKFMNVLLNMQHGFQLVLFAIGIHQILFQLMNIAFIITKGNNQLNQHIIQILNI